MAIVELVNLRIVVSSRGSFAVVGRATLQRAGQRQRARATRGCAFSSLRAAET
jgi:hypothetical protein